MMMIIMMVMVMVMFSKTTFHGRQRDWLQQLAISLMYLIMKRYIYREEEETVKWSVLRTVRLGPKILFAYR